MKLDTIDQRMEFVGDLIEEAFIFQGSLDISNADEDHDWCAAAIVIDDLNALETMMEAEKIFVLTVGGLRDPRYANRDNQEIYSDIFGEGFDRFIFELLMGRLSHAFNILDDWGFRTERGVKFRENFCEKIDALMDKYANNYGIFATNDDDVQKIDTADDRLEVVKKLLDRAQKIRIALQSYNERTDIGDVAILISMAEKLDSLRNLIQIEVLWGQMFDETLALNAIDYNTRSKCHDITSKKFHVFLCDILIPTLDKTASLTDADLRDRRLMHFQKNARKTLSDFISVYKEIIRP